MPVPALPNNEEKSLIQQEFQVFWDRIRTSSKPIIATHSGCWALRYGRKRDSHFIRISEGRFRNPIPFFTALDRPRRNDRWHRKISYDECDTRSHTLELAQETASKRAQPARKRQLASGSRVGFEEKAQESLHEG